MTPEETIEGLIDKGFLAKYFITPIPGSLVPVNSKIDRAIESYKKFGSLKSTIVFTNTVAESKEVAEKFRKAGFSFEHIDAQMGLHERARLLEEFECKEIHGLVNCSILQGGIEINTAECVILMKKTSSCKAHEEMISPYPEFGKEKNNIVLDVVNNVQRTGIPFHNKTEWNKDAGSDPLGDIERFNKHAHAQSKKRSNGPDRKNSQRGSAAHGEGKPD